VKRILAAVLIALGLAAGGAAIAAPAHADVPSTWYHG
jgi:hypothetical protein